MRILAVCFAFFLATPNFVSADEYLHGWTKESADNFISHCTAAGVDHQLLLLRSSGKITKDMPLSDVLNIRARLTPLVSRICECTQRAIMADRSVSEMSNALSDHGYFNGVMARCVTEK